MVYNLILLIVFVFISGCGDDPSTSPVVINDDLPVEVWDAIEAGLDQVEVPGGQDEEGLSKPTEGLITVYHLDYASPPIQNEHEKPVDTSCGEADVYSKMGYQWTTFPLLYTINTANLAAGVNRASAKAAVIRAFKTWDEAEHPIGLLFKEGTSSTAKIKVKWSRIDGVGKTAAMAATTYEQSSKKATKTTITFDTGDKWGVYGSAIPCVSSGKVNDIENIVAHEIGHLLGLGHTGTENGNKPATMYPYILFPGETDKRTLTAGEQAGIKAIYP